MAGVQGKSKLQQERAWISLNDSFSFCFTTERMQWPSAETICVARYLQSKVFKERWAPRGFSLCLGSWRSRVLWFDLAQHQPGCQQTSGEQGGCAVSQRAWPEMCHYGPLQCCLLSRVGCAFGFSHGLLDFLSSVAGGWWLAICRSWVQQVSLFECSRVAFL